MADNDKQYRVKRSKAEKGRSLKKSISAGKSAFSFMVKHGGKHYKSNSNDKRLRTGASKEVMVKITGKGNCKKMIKFSLNYISREDSLPLTDKDGNQITVREAADFMTVNEDPEFTAGDKNPPLTANIVFSPPLTARVTPEDAIESVRNTLAIKFPENEFVLAYHNDKKEHPHVHAIIRLKDNTGHKMHLNKQTIRDLRTGFCDELKIKDYDVKATHKQIPDLKNTLKTEFEAVPKRQKGIYEVVDFGRSPYLFDSKNKPQNYITVKTLNKGKEITYWGKEFGELCQREEIRAGSLIKLKKTGATDIQVPDTDKNGQQTGWKTTKRNQWDMENVCRTGIDRTVRPGAETDPAKTLQKMQEQKNRYRYQAAEMLKQQQKISAGIKI